MEPAQGNSGRTSRTRTILSGLVLSEVRIHGQTDNFPVAVVATCDLVELFEHLLDLAIPILKLWNLLLWARTKMWSIVHIAIRVSSSVSTGWGFEFQIQML